MSLHLIQLTVVLIFSFTSVVYGYSGSHAYNKMSLEKSSVNAATGSFDFSHSVISTQGIREPFELNLTYRFNRKGLFGLPEGWQLDLDYIDNKTANIHGQQWLIDPLWRDETLTASGLKYYNQHGSKFIDQIEAKPVPGFADHTFRFVLKHNDGSLSYFSHQGLLVLKVDRFNNAIHFNYHQPVRSLESARLDSIVDNYGNKYRFIYAPNEMRVLMPDQRELILYNGKDGIMKIVDPLKLHTDITYVKQFNRTLIKSIESPSGLFVNLTYSSIHFKSGGETQAMPVVDSLEKIDRATNKILEQTHYTYSADNNFTGYPSYSLSDNTDSLMDSNDQSYRYWVQITKSDLGSPPKFHSQLFYYNYLHLPIEVYTLKEGRPYLKTAYAYMISPFKYSRSTNYDKPQMMNSSLWSEPHGRFVDTERKTHNYDRHGKKTFESHEAFDRVNEKWKAIFTHAYTYHPNYSLKKSAIKTDHVTGQKLKKSYALSSDKKTHQSATIAYIQGENSEQWQPWRKEVFTFDNNGRKTYHSRQWLTKDYPGPEKTWLHTTYDFDSDSKALTIAKIRASGAARKSVIDTRNNQRIKQITPLNETSSYHYDALNRLTKTIDPLGYVTAHTYDTHQQGGANTVITTSPLGYKYRTTFDAKHQPIHRHDHYDNQWRHLSSQHYNGLGKVVEHTDINHLSSTTQMDEFDRPLVHVDIYGNKTEYAYDDFLLTTTLYLNKHKVHEKQMEPWNSLVRERFYSNLDNPGDSQHETIENTTRHSGFKKKIEETNSLVDRYDSVKKESVTRHFVYDPSLNVIEEKTQGFDGAEYTINYSHDIFNHAVTKRKTLSENDKHSTSQGETYRYDTDGQLSEVESPTLPSGEQLITRFTYNKNGKRIKAVLPSRQSISQTYNCLNLPEQASWMRDGKRYHITHQYDADRRIASAKDSKNQLLRFSYLDNGLLTGITYPDGQNYSVTYDDRNRKIKEKTFAGPVHHFHYDENDLGKLTEIRSNDLSVHYLYGEDDNDNKHQLIQRIYHQPKTGETVESIAYGSQGLPIKTEVHNRQAGLIYEVNYAFNPRKQLVGLSAKSHKGHLKPELVAMDYRYNALNQLISEKLTNGDDSRELHYQHDANGNLTLEQELIDGSHSNKSFVYNSWDQLVEVVSSYAPHNGKLTYDPDGRLIKDHQGVEYAYDDSGYLLSVTTPSERIDYDYWPNGQLSHRKVSNAQSTQSTQIYHDHNKSIIAMNENDHWRYLLKDRQRILASSDAPATTSSNEQHSAADNNTNEWFMSNHSVGALLSDEGNLSTKHYMAYGASLKTNATDSKGLLGWHQAYLDTTADLVYFKSRFYSPSLKRFITPDTLLVDNRYRYAKSNPLFYYDPTGHAPRGVNYGFGLIATALGSVGIFFAIPTGGASLTLSGGAAIAAGVSSALSGAALMGSQGALDNGNKQAAKALQATSLGLGVAALASGAASFAPAISGWLATGEFNVASHWYNVARIWDDLASRVPGASTSTGGSRIVLSGLTIGEQQGNPMLTDAEWAEVIQSNNRMSRIATIVNLVGQPPKIHIALPNALRISLSTLAGSIINTALASVGVYQSFGSTDTEDTDSESTDADMNQNKQSGAIDPNSSEALNWTEIRGHKDQNSQGGTLENDNFFSAANDPFGIH